MQRFEERLDQHNIWWSNEQAEAVRRVEAEEAAKQAAAAAVLTQVPAGSSGEEDNSGNETSSLSAVSSSRYEGLEDDWWKENGNAGEVGGKVGGEVVTVRLQSRKGRV
jgi:hypothetical protein